MNQYKSIFKLTAYIVSLLLVSFHIGYVLTYMTLSIDTIFLIMYFIFFILISSNTPESKKTTEMSLIFSMVPLGSFVGSCFSQFPLRYLTRKQSLLIADFIGLLSFFTLIPNRECIIIFRFFFGFSNGLSSVLMPTFLKEVCPS